MNALKLKVVESLYDGAVAAGCDCVMLKHKGAMVEVECVDTICTIVMPPVSEQITLNGVGSVSFVGTLNPFTKQVVLHDTHKLSGRSCLQLTYRERYLLTRKHFTCFDNPRFSVVSVAPISHARALWLTVQSHPDLYSGLVFRRSQDTDEGVLYIARYYPEAPKAL